MAVPEADRDVPPKTVLWLTSRVPAGATDNRLYRRDIGKRVDLRLFDITATNGPGTGGRIAAAAAATKLYQPVSKYYPNPGGLDARLSPWQDQLRPQAANRGSSELELTPIEGGKLDYDRQSQPGARLGLVEPPAATRDLLALRR